MIIDYIGMTIMLLTSSKDFKIKVLPNGDPDQIIYQVILQKELAGRVIGRHGETIKSLRALVFAMSMHQEKKRSEVIVQPI